MKDGKYKKEDGETWEDSPLIRESLRILKELFPHSHIGLSALGKISLYEYSRDGEFKRVHHILKRDSIPLCIVRSNLHHSDSRNKLKYEYGKAGFKNAMKVLENELLWERDKRIKESFEENKK